jgi:hypothetical protein
MEKPSTLEHLISVLPIPYYGEKACKNVVSYYRQLNDLRLDAWTDHLAMEKEIKNEVRNIRIFAYAASGAPTLVYGSMKLYEALSPFF